MIFFGKNFALRVLGLKEPEIGPKQSNGTFTGFSS